MTDQVALQRIGPVSLAKADIRRAHPNTGWLLDAELKMQLEGGEYARLQLEMPLKTLPATTEDEMRNWLVAQIQRLLQAPSATRLSVRR